VRFHRVRTTACVARGFRRNSLAVLVGVSAGCGYTQPDCVRVPCALPIAVMVSVTSAAGGPVPGLTLTFSGAASGSGPCTVGPSAATCVVPGTAGTYGLRLTAAGFQDRTLTVTVQGSTPACGCPSVQTERLAVVLDPS
jgi:hypothetical protein